MGALRGVLKLVFEGFKGSEHLFSHERDEGRFSGGAAGGQGLISVRVVGGEQYTQDQVAREGRVQNLGVTQEVMKGTVQGGVWYWAGEREKSKYSGYSPKTPEDFYGGRWWEWYM